MISLFTIDLHFISVKVHPSELGDGIETSVHNASALHPPLLIEHEYSQYGRQVVSHILHSDPMGH